MNDEGATRVSDHCGGHREKYPARPPDYAKLRNEDEKDQVGADDGLFEFVFPSSAGIVVGKPPSSKADMAESEASKYLWVITPDAVPGALERHATVTVLKRGSLTHTNLTGGADAHTAGELWFQDAMTVVINGGSSRYTPRNLQELESAALAFKSAGYKVAHLGWEKDSNSPLRSQTEKMTWL